MCGRCPSLLEMRLLHLLQERLGRQRILPSKVQNSTQSAFFCYKFLVFFLVHVVLSIILSCSLCIEGAVHTSSLPWIATLHSECEGLVVMQEVHCIRYLSIKLGLGLW